MLDAVFCSLSFHLTPRVVLVYLSAVSEQERARHRADRAELSEKRCLAHLFALFCVSFHVFGDSCSDQLTFITLNWCCVHVILCSRAVRDLELETQLLGKQLTLVPIAHPCVRSFHCCNCFRLWLPTRTQRQAMHTQQALTRTRKAHAASRGRFDGRGPVLAVCAAAV